MAVSGGGAGYRLAGGAYSLGKWSLPPKTAPSDISTLLVGAGPTDSAATSGRTRGAGGCRGSRGGGVLVEISRGNGKAVGRGTATRPLRAARMQNGRRQRQILTENAVWLEPGQYGSGPVFLQYTCCRSPDVAELIICAGPSLQGGAGACLWGDRRAVASATGDRALKA